jgi:hypothetical protein
MLIITIIIVIILLFLQGRNRIVYSIVEDGGRR